MLCVTCVHRNIEAFFCVMCMHTYASLNLEHFVIPWAHFSLILIFATSIVHQYSLSCCFSDISKNFGWKCAQVLSAFNSYTLHNYSKNKHPLYAGCGCICGAAVAVLAYNISTFHSLQLCLIHTFGCTKYTFFFYMRSYFLKIHKSHTLFSHLEENLRTVVGIYSLHILSVAIYVSE